MTFEMDRRSLLIGGSALGATASLGYSMRPLWAQDTPRQGGTFRLAIADFDSGETLDPQMNVSQFMTNLQWQIRNNLIEVGPGGVLVPELATSWEPNADATVWTFKLRNGVEFHNGKTMTAADVVWSLNLHRGPDTVSYAKSLMAQISDIKATAPGEITVILKAPNATFPALMTTVNLLIVPADIKNFDEGIGTGGYKFESYEPGVKAYVTRNPNYWKEGRAHFSEIETLAIKDVSARTTALQTGQIDAMNFVDPTTAKLLKTMPGVDLVQTSGSVLYAFSMDTTLKPFIDNRVRTALKLAIDRQEMLDKILGGFGSIANDQPLSKDFPDHNPNLEQHTYDPDRALALMKEANAEGATVRLHVADTPFTGAVDAAQLYSATAARGGIKIEVIREPDDGYWSNVWGKKPFFGDRWSPRPNEDVMLSLGFSRESIGSWNTTKWDNDAFNKLLTAARGELDSEKRKTLYWECQSIVATDGGMIAPVFADHLDAKSPKVATESKLAGNWGLDGARASERWWFSA
jgi:peptide/nickel transport system substrate-binding protein